MTSLPQRNRARLRNKNKQLKILRRSKTIPALICHRHTTFLDQGLGSTAIREHTINEEECLHQIRWTTSSNLLCHSDHYLTLSDFLPHPNLLQNQQNLTLWDGVRFTPPLKSTNFHSYRTWMYQIPACIANTLPAANRTKHLINLVFSILSRV